MTAKYSSDAGDEILALSVAGWILSDARRADRLLSLTGLDADALRAGLITSDAQVLGAMIGFVRDHEADLIACAEAIGVTPDLLAGAYAPREGFEA